MGCIENLKQNSSGVFGQQLINLMSLSIFKRSYFVVRGLYVQQFNLLQSNFLKVELVFYGLIKLKCNIKD